VKDFFGRRVQVDAVPDVFGRQLESSLLHFVPKASVCRTDLQVFPLLVGSVSLQMTDQAVEFLF
jgi:hypothetical protein